MQQSIWVNGLNRKIKLQIRKMNLKKKLFILVFILLNIYGLLCGVIYFFQENLIFMPSVLSQEHVFEMKSSFDEINLKSSDGAHLNGLYFKKENSKGVVLYFKNMAIDYLIQVSNNETIKDKKQNFFLSIPHLDKILREYFIYFDNKDLSNKSLYYNYNLIKDLSFSKEGKSFLIVKDLSVTNSH